MHLLTQIRRRFITSIPIKFVIRKSKNIVLPGFAGIPLFDVVRFFFIQIQKTSLNERAASIAFNLLVAIPPACIFLFTLLPYLPIKEFSWDNLTTENKKVRIKAKAIALKHDSLKVFKSVKVISIDKIDGKTYGNK